MKWKNVLHNGVEAIAIQRIIVKSCWKFEHNHVKCTSWTLGTRSLWLTHCPPPDPVWPGSSAPWSPPHTPGEARAPCHWSAASPAPPGPWSETSAPVSSTSTESSARRSQVQSSPSKFVRSTQFSETNSLTRTWLLRPSDVCHEQTWQNNNFK